MKRRLLAEALGTFFLVLAGTGAIVVNEASGAVTHVGVSLTFGLVVLAMIHTVGDVSGAHINPAVTFAFALAGRFPGRDVPGYVIAQSAGAAAASAALAALFPASETLGATLPAGAPWRSLLLETLITLLLMLVILAVAVGPKEKGLMAGVAVGGAVALGALFAGPVSGASMNPARSLGPALVSGHVEHLWIYIAGPVAGAAAAVPIAAILFGRRNPAGAAA